MDIYLFKLTDRASILKTRMSTRRQMTLPLKIWKTSFYSSDLTTYPQKIFQLFFYNKARRSVISKCGPRYSSIDCDQVLFPSVSSLTHSYLTHNQAFLWRKGKKIGVLFPRFQNKKWRSIAWSQVNSHLNHSTLSSISIEQRPLKTAPTDSSF